MPVDSNAAKSERLPSMDDGRLMFAFAHDVRAHLRTILTRIQLVQRSGAALLPEADQSMLRDAASSTGAIDRLLAAMLSLVEPADEEGETTSLPLLIQGSLIDLKPHLAGAEVAVESNLDLPVPVGLRRVMRELLANACKFRTPGRPLQIRITSHLTPDSILRICVSDNGLGVAPAHLEKLFQPFSRLYPRADYPGNGLGLAICRKIVSDLRGSIHATVSPMGGLCVEIELPLC